MTTLRQPHMVGAVRIGTPDDYVMRFLPGILARFAQAYPLVRWRCTASRRASCCSAAIWT